MENTQINCKNCIYNPALLPCNTEVGIWQYRASNKVKIIIETLITSSERSLKEANICLRTPVSPVSLSALDKGICHFCNDSKNSKKYIEIIYSNIYCL